MPKIDPLSGRELGASLTREDRQRQQARQHDAANRYAILNHRWDHLIAQYIERTHVSGSVKASLKNDISTEWNVLDVIADRVAVAYDVPPTRVLKDASKTEADDWKALVRESGISTVAKQWIREAFALNSILVVPVVRDRRLSWDRILPYHSEVFRNAAGKPIAALWWEDDTTRLVRGNAYAKRSVFLDDRAWYYYDADGNEDVGARTYHNAGVFPGVEMRLHVPPTDDPWDRHRGSGAVRASIAVGYIHTKLAWVRRGQDRYRELLVSEQVQSIPVQVAGAEGPIEIPLAKADVEWIAQEVNTPITNHREHATYIAGLAGESYGIASSEFNLDPTSNDAANVSQTANGRRHAALSRVRNRQIDHLRQFEEDLWWRASLVMRGMRHPMGRRWQPDAIAERFEVDWPPLTFAEHPIIRAQILEKEISLGLKSTFQAMRELHPRMSPQDAREAVIRIAEEEAELNAIYIEHNIPRDAKSRRASVAALQGRLGGLTGGGRPPTSDEDDNDDGNRTGQPGRAANNDDE